MHREELREGAARTTNGATETLVLAAENQEARGPEIHFTK